MESAANGESGFDSSFKENALKSILKMALGVFSSSVFNVCFELCAHSFIGSERFLFSGVFAEIIRWLSTDEKQNNEFFVE